MTDFVSMLGVSQRNAARTMSLAVTRSVLKISLSNIGSDAELIARGKVEMVFVDRSLFMGKWDMDILFMMIIVIVVILINRMLSIAFLAIAMRTLAVTVRTLAVAVRMLAVAVRTLAVATRMFAFQSLKLLIAAQ